MNYAPRLGAFLLMMGLPIFPQETPPRGSDAERLAAYAKGAVGPEQATLSEELVKLARALSTRGRDREAADALRKALMFHPTSAKAGEAWRARPAVPPDLRAWKPTPLPRDYSALLQDLARKNSEALNQAANAFAENGLPLAAHAALELLGTGRAAEAVRGKLARHPLRIMSFNLLMAHLEGPPGSGERWPWSERWPLIETILREEQPDIVGAQEVNGWPDKLEESFGDLFAWHGSRQAGADRDSFDCAVFYNRHRFEIVAKGFRYLNRHDDVKTRGADWGATEPRELPWITLRDRATGFRFHVFNTHLAWAKESFRADDGRTGTAEDLRRRQLDVCLEEFDRVDPLCPRLFLGDFNTGNRGPVAEACLSAGGFPRDNCAFAGIDWILCSPGMRLVDWHWRTQTGPDGKLRASDHPAVLAQIEVPSTKDLAAEWRKVPGDRARLEAYVLALQDVRKMREVLRTASKENDSSAPWVLASVEARFGTAAEAVRLYRQLREDGGGPEAQFRIFETQLVRETVTRADRLEMKRFAEDAASGDWGRSTAAAVERYLMRKVARFEALVDRKRFGPAELQEMARFAAEELNRPWADTVKKLLEQATGRAPK